jgi:hypothetical protein
MLEEIKETLHHHAKLLSNHSITLEKQHSSLEEHMRRTKNLEESQVLLVKKDEQQDLRIGQLEFPSRVVNWLATNTTTKLLGIVAGAAAAFYTVIEILQAFGIFNR